MRRKLIYSVENFDHPEQVLVPVTPDDKNNAPAPKKNDEEPKAE